MSTDEVVGIIVGVATIYFLWKGNELSKEQNQIFREQNQIFRTGQEGKPMTPVPRPITGLRRYWPMLGMALLAITTWAAVGYDIYDQHRQPDSTPSSFDETPGNSLPIIADKQFQNETIEIDGKHFDNCTFTNVSFMYHGRAHWGISNSHFFESVEIRTDNKAASTFFDLARGLGMTGGNLLKVKEGVSMKLPSSK